LIFRAFQNLPIPDQVITLWWLSVPDRNLHFDPADFTSFTKRILKNAGIQKTVNATAPFSMGSLDISGFDSLRFCQLCWR
jgi:hypothetical protein